MNAPLMIGDRIATADLSDMENLHGFLVTLPIAALAIGTLGLIFAVHTRARRLRIVALALVLISSALVWPICYYFGAHDVSRIWNEVESRWMQQQVRPPEAFASTFCVVAVLAAITIITELRLPRAAVPLAIATLIPAIAAVGLGAYIAFTDCRPGNGTVQNEVSSQGTAQTVDSSELVRPYR